MNDSGLMAAVDRRLNEPCVFVAIRQPGKVVAHLAWVRLADIERLPLEFVQENILMGERK